MGIDLVATVMAMAVVVAAVTGSAAQTSPSCASNLMGCAGYINSTTTPPQSCCGPLKEAATNDLACLCGLFNNTAILKAFGVDIKQALQMAKSCGVSTDPTACAAAPAAASTTSPPSSTNASGSSSGKVTNSAHGVMSIELLGLGRLLLSLWLLML